MQVRATASPALERPFEYPEKTGKTRQGQQDYRVAGGYPFLHRAAVVAVHYPGFASKKLPMPALPFLWRGAFPVGSPVNGIEVNDRHIQQGSQFDG